MQLKLTTRSFVLMGSGEGHALLDADIMFDPHGFPFVPGRRIKGLLKESMLETLEAYGIDAHAAEGTVADLFGKPGTANPAGRLRFTNLVLEGGKDLREDIEGLRRAYPEVFHPDNIKGRYCTELSQTAVEDGVFKDGSLRTYRVLRPGISFEGALDGTDGLPATTRQWLEDAVSNLRSAGTRRNRGFGEIQVQALASTPDESESKPTNAQPESGEVRSLQIEINVLEPLMLGKVEGEKNTIGTQDYIPGNVIRGLVAELRMRGLQATSPAHLDDWFRELVLCDGLRFGPCFLDGQTPLPLNIQKEKVGHPTKAFDAFRQAGSQPRAIGGQGRVGADGRLSSNKVKMRYQFHNSRPNRVAGKSMQDDAEQGIFYYESIAEGSTFVGRIQGEPDAIAQLQALMPAPLETRMGKSRSAQYGKVRVTLSAATAPGKGKQGRHYVSLRSPALLLNTLGSPCVQLATLQRYLAESDLVGCLVEADHYFTFLHVEQYNSIWDSKTPRSLALGSGSVFQMQVAEHQLAAFQEWLDRGLGENVAQGWGQLQAWHQADFPQKMTLPGKAEKAKPQEGVPTPLWKGPVPEIKNTVLKALWDDAVQKALRAKMRTLGRQQARSVNKPVPNHLCSRILNEQLSGTQMPSRTDWIAWLQNVEAKQAGKSLDDAGLLRKMKEIVFDQIAPHLAHLPAGEARDAMALEYWKAFFETMRRARPTPQTQVQS